MSRVRGPLGVLALSILAGALTGIVACHLVLAAWTYRHAGRRGADGRARWTAAVLVGGIFAFVPYVIAQGVGDSQERGLLGTAAGFARKSVRVARRSLRGLRRLVGAGGGTARSGVRLARLAVRSVRAVLRVLRRVDRTRTSPPDAD